MGEHHSDMTNNAPPQPAFTSGSEDLSSYIGGSLSPSFKAKVMIVSSTDDIEDCDMGMEGVEEEVITLAVQNNTSQHHQTPTTITTDTVVAFASTTLASKASFALDGHSQTELLNEQLMSTTDSARISAAGVKTTGIVTSQADHSEPTKDIIDREAKSSTPPLCKDEGTDQEIDAEDEEEESSDNDDDENTNTDEQCRLDEEPSIITTTDAIYSAVPVSSELHIFPHSSKGFNWNQDLFLKPHQRRNLGVDELHSAIDASVGDVASQGGSSSSGRSGNNNSNDGHVSAIRVHEIRLDQCESEKIFPSS
ncbi:hypothetical protein FBU30_008343 [Linnemannia zychae]|nr:hypothetical protein FBU30_008343 [Linnemannia zychae]